MSQVYVRTFMLLPYGVYFMCRNFTLPLFKKDVLVRNGCFYPMRSVFIFTKQAFFILNCVSELKLAKTFLILIK